jgi:hypothetical protein
MTAKVRIGVSVGYFIFESPTVYLTTLSNASWSPHKIVDQRSINLIPTFVQRKMAIDMPPNALGL